MAFLVEYLIVFNIVAFALYAVDKLIACCHCKYSRIPERTLLAASAIGPIGSLIGMIFCCHKTRKAKFWIQNGTFLLLHCYLFVQMIFKKYQLVTDPKIRSDFNMDGFETPGGGGSGGVGSDDDHHHQQQQSRFQFPPESELIEDLHPEL